MPTFIDLFAGAGGFSEGFLQVEYDSKYYDFLLASDINTKLIVMALRKHTLNGQEKDD